MPSADSLSKCQMVLPIVGNLVTNSCKMISIKIMMISKVIKYVVKSVIHIFYNKHCNTVKNKL